MRPKFNKGDRVRLKDSEDIFTIEHRQITSYGSTYHLRNDTTEGRAHESQLILIEENNKNNGTKI